MRAGPKGTQGKCGDPTKEGSACGICLVSKSDYFCQYHIITYRNAQALQGQNRVHYCYEFLLQLAVNTHPVPQL